ncbi:MAG TPA: beta-galactosidase [Candidatus Dormibacteraeota bacterium]|nr:beta-galactosidase [Candidatus Dormibacteraeota bacterium]
MSTGVEEPRVAVVPGRGLQVGERVVPLVSGAAHYWRLDPERWGDVLDAVRSLGFEVVETYVPWAVHETARGEFDFSGRLDVERWIRMAGERGLHVLVRPGPHINSELPDFGYPTRVLWDERVMARSALGTPIIYPSRTHFFPAPSYASPELYEETAIWFDAVIPRLAALQHPDGPVIAAQVDNEFGYFFHFEPYLFDHHPEFVRQWREWSGLDDAPPADAGAPEHVTMSWSRFRQVHMRESLRRLAGMMRQRGMRIPLYHNDWTVFAPPLDPAALEQSGAVDFDGSDMYCQREILGNAKNTARKLAGSVQVPWIPEIGAGWVSDCFGIPMRIERLDEEGAMLATLLCGVRGWNFYMLVERDQWYGSPIGRRGEVRPDATLHRQLTTFLRDLDWWSLQREAPVLLLHRADVIHAANARMRSNATAAILEETQLPTALRRVADAGREEHDAVLDAWRTGLERRGIDFDEGSADAPPDLSRYALVVVPGGDAPLLQHPHVRHAAPADADLDALPVPEFVPAAAETGVSVHHFHDGARGLRLLGALNLNGSDRHVRLRTRGGRVTLTPRWTAGDDVVQGDGEVTVRVPAYSGQIWEVTR